MGALTCEYGVSRLDELPGLVTLVPIGALLAAWQKATRHLVAVIMVADEVVAARASASERSPPCAARRSGHVGAD